MRDPETRHTFLFNGPQLGYSVPELFVEFEVHYPGLDMRGVSAAGVPVLGIGHNDHIAWGFTSGIDMLNRAESIPEVDTAMRNVTWNENVMAIDSQGRIGYWHPGLHQLRPRRYDERLPYPGTGEAEWRGLRNRANTPHVVNPRRNYLANWNNLPARGWTTGDGESQERLSGNYHRGQFLLRVVRGAARAPSYEAAKRLLTYVGTTAQQRPLALVRLRRAQRGAQGQAKQIFDALLTWDGSYHRVDGDSTVDPGVAIWEELKDQLELIALAKLSPDKKVLEPMASGTGSSHAFDISDGEAYATRTSTPAEWRTAATATHAALEKRFGTGEVAKWREPRRMYSWSAQGAGSPPPLPFFDRGTWEQFVELGP